MIIIAFIRYSYHVYLRCIICNHNVSHLFTILITFIHDLSLQSIMGFCDLLCLVVMYCKCSHSIAICDLSSFFIVIFFFWYPIKASVETWYVAQIYLTNQHYYEYANWRVVVVGRVVVVQNCIFKIQNWISEVLLNLGI